MGVLVADLMGILNYRFQSLMLIVTQNEEQNSNDGSKIKADGENAYCYCFRCRGESPCLKSCTAILIDQAEQNSTFYFSYRVTFSPKHISSTNISPEASCARETAVGTWKRE
jgi:hypothetical protein